MVRVGGGAGGWEMVQTAVEAHEDDLHSPYWEGVREAAAACIDLDLGGKRASFESLHRQPPSATTAEREVADDMLSKAMAQLRESQEALHALRPAPRCRLPRQQ